MRLCTQRRNGHPPRCERCTWPNRRSLHPTGRLPAQSRLAGVYVIAAPLARGAWPPSIRRPISATSPQVAIKEMSQDSLAPSELQEALDGFVQEAELLMGLRHKGLPRVSGHFSEGSRHYLVMEYIEGKTLEQRQTAAGGKGLPERDVLAWADQICDVLTYLHNRRPPIIFRDLKPANIMVTASGRIKLIDFGIARVFVPGRTRDTQVLGTPGLRAAGAVWQGADRSARRCLRAGLHALPVAHGLRSRQHAVRAATAQFARAHDLAACAGGDRARHQTGSREPISLRRRFSAGAEHPEGMYFRTGECAHSLRELVALCQTHPKEAAEQLYARRFDPGCRAGASARPPRRCSPRPCARRIRRQGWPRFLRWRQAPAPAAKTTAARPSAQATRQRTTQQPPRTGQSARGTTTHAAASAAPSATASLVTVQPRTIDFGQLKRASVAR